MPFQERLEQWSQVGAGERGQHPKFRIHNKASIR
jgi:hypothetical protein